jgi:hypothetical protein
MRFLKVIGNSKDLVANPHASNAEPRRYAGYRSRTDQSHVPTQDAFDIAAVSALARYEPHEETIADDPALRKAIARHELILRAEGSGPDHGRIVWPEPRVSAAPRAASKES